MLFQKQVAFLYRFVRKFIDSNRDYANQWWAEKRNQEDFDLHFKAWSLPTKYVTIVLRGYWLLFTSSTYICETLAIVCFMHVQQASNLIMQKSVDEVTEQESDSVQGRGCKNAHGLLNSKALKSSTVYITGLFHCMGEISWVEFQRYPLNFRKKPFHIHWKTWI